MEDTHALNRTSPNGGPFIGTCFKCGATDLPSQAVSWRCSNVANLSQDEALSIAIDAHDKTEEDGNG